MISVGAEALHVRRILNGPPRLWHRVIIVSETPKQWEDDAGERFWKAQPRKAPRLINHYLMTEAEYLNAGGVL